MRSPHLRPGTPRPPLPAWLGLLLVLVLGMAGARPAMALELSVDPPRERRGYAWVDVTLSDLFSTRVTGSLARGMPATLTLHAELWRRRPGWFDRLENTFDAILRLRYDFRISAYRLERAGARPLVVSSLDSVAILLSRPLALPAGRVGTLRAEQHYFVVVTATLSPLSVEDVEEVEGWLSGEVEERGGEPFGFITGLPRSMFDTARNFAGLGDEHARATTEEFGLQDLFGTR